MTMMLCITACRAWIKVAAIMAMRLCIATLQGMDSVLMDAGGGALTVPPPYKCDLEDSLALTAHRGLRSVGQPSPTGSVAASSTDPTAVDAVEMNWRVSACNAVHNTVLGMPVSPSFWVTWYQAESKEHVMYLLDVRAAVNCLHVLCFVQEWAHVHNSSCSDCAA